MDCGWPAISSTTSTPSPPACSRIAFCTFCDDGSSTRSAFIAAAIFLRFWFTSIANTCAAPTARATAIENNPIGPHPVIATVFPAISPASTEWTAFPSGSRMLAYS